MDDWRELLARLVAARGTKQFPLLVFEAMPPSRLPWPTELPSCRGLKDFYSLCDGGVLSLQYNWLPLEQVAAETTRWREGLHDYHGDGKPILLPGRHMVVATDSSGAPVIWDAAEDRMSSFFPKGGDWEPFDMSFERFMTALFCQPEEVDADDDMWAEALQQLSRPE